MRLSRLVLSGVLFLCAVSRVDAKDVLPVPGYDNTFYMLIGDGYRGSTEGQTAYDSLWPMGGLDIDYQILKLEEILSRLGPDGPYLRIGMADALWPMDVVDTSAVGDWEYKGLEGLNGSTFGEEGDSPDQSRVGPDSYFNNTVMKSWAQLDMPGILFIHSLGGQNWKSVSDSMADPGNLTAFLEQNPEAVQRYDDGKISVADNGDGIHSPIDYVEGLYMDPSFNDNAPDGTMLTLSRLMPDSLRNGYQRRNIQAAMRHILEINMIYPGMIVAVSIEPENDMNSVRCYQGECDYWADFSPLALEEWRQWLFHYGIYGPAGEYEGADPWFQTLDEFNVATGSSFDSLPEIDPRSIKAGPDLWDMYLDGGDLDGEWTPGNQPGSGHEQGWCELMIEHRCEDSVNWLWEEAFRAGWTRSQIFTHQVPGGFVDQSLDVDWRPFWGYEHRMCTLNAVKVANGRPGITGFRELTVDEDLFSILQGEMSQDGAWANLEYNPIAESLFVEYDSDYDLWVDSYKKNWEWGAHILAVFRWWVPPETSTWWACIRPEHHREGSSIDFEDRLQATHDFITNDVHRFKPWSPGGGSLEEESDFVPPSPTVTELEYDYEEDIVSIAIDPEIFPGCPRLLWFDTEQHELWPNENNVFGWPEFTEGHFNVHRDTVPGFTPGWSNVVSSVMMPELSFSDTSLPGTGGVFYAVVAVDNQGDWSTPATGLWVVPEIAFPHGNSLTVSMAQGSSKDTSLTVVNKGDRLLVIEMVVSDSPWMDVLDDPPTLHPGEQDTISIRLSAKDLEAADYHGQLQFTSNDPFEPEINVDVLLRVSAQAGSASAFAEELMLRPQPASREVYLKWSCGAGRAKVSVEVVDLGGRVVYRQFAATDGDGVLNTRLDLPKAIGSGVYVVRLSFGKHIAKKRMIVVN